MLELAIAGLLCFMATRTFQGSLSADGQSISLPDFDKDALKLGVLAALLALYLLDLNYGLALITAVIIHEFGHVAAHRFAGHRDARFRLLPLFARRSISNQLPRSQESDFFISIMGAGISIAPMVTALVLAALTKDVLPAVSEHFRIFGSTMAALNFINLLPLWPLDGGRCLRMICQSLIPARTTQLTLAASAMAAALAVHAESGQLLLLVLLGAHAFFAPDDLKKTRPSMSRRHGLLALATYLAVASVHLTGGAWLIAWFLW